MMKIREAGDRGHFNFGWLDTYHTFSFGEYHDPQQMGFRSLRVMNEDRVQPGQGFGTHPHRDMEIITYVLEGALEHKDSIGNGSVIRPGEVQRMSAGTGVTHSEYNPSQEEWVHLFQIWILPEKKGMPPSYEQKKYPDKEKKGQFRLIASRKGRDGSVTIHQDAELYAALLDPGQEVHYQLPPGRHAWLQVARGAVSVNGKRLHQSDGVSVSDEDFLRITAKEKAEFLLFNLG